MTTASNLRLAAIVALLASSLLHVAAMAISPEFVPVVEIEGSDSKLTAALGSNFADLVKAGDRLAPVETEHSAIATPTPQTQPIPSVTEPLVAQSGEALPSPNAASPPAFKVEPSRTESLIAPSATEVLTPVEPELATVQPRNEPREQLEPKPSETKTEPVRPAEIVTPVPRPKPVVKPKKEKVQPRKKSSAGSETSRSRISNKAGAQDGKVTARAASSGKTKTTKSTDSGNAAASNYPGKVYARIARTRQKNSGGRGVAHVGFTVSASGQAVGISVSRSSGNARVDSAALAHVKRAAPFPKPPSGAQTRFVIPIEFRR